MKLSKPLKNPSTDRAKPADWIAFITEDCSRPVIPVGPRFQADIPSWNPLPSESRRRRLNDDAKWLGARVWPLNGRSPHTGHDTVGKGRPPTCKCEFPGSIGCVRRHMYEKKLELEKDVGPAFWKWRFNVMGEDACKLWSEEEERKFDYIFKMELTSKSKGFFKSAMQCFPSHSKQSIAHYYLNVYVPRRISVQVRLKYKIIDSDNDDSNSDDEHDRRRGRGRGGGGGGDVVCVEGSLKRLHAADLTSSSSCKYIKKCTLNLAGLTVEHSREEGRFYDV